MTNNKVKKVPFDSLLIVWSIGIILNYWVSNNLEQSILKSFILIFFLLLFNTIYNIFNQPDNIIFSIKSFLCTAGGAKINILQEKCPHEISKYTVIGLTIVFTGVLASLSGGYAIYKVFNNIYCAIGFGIFWGLIILNLDIMMVKSISKNGSIVFQLLQAIPRIALASVLALVISKPLEVKIFENRIKREIQNNIFRENKLDSIKIEMTYGSSKLYNEVKEKESTLKILNTDKHSDPKDGRFKELLSEEQKVSNRIKKLDSEIGFIINNINKSTSNSAVEKLIQEKEKTIRKRDTEQVILNRIRNDIENYRVEYTKKIDKKIQYEEKLLMINQDIKTKMDSLSIAKRLKLEGINDIAFSETLVTQIEALGTLTQWEDNEKDINGVIISRKNNIIWWASLLITLLFMLLETAPIFAKILSPKGEFDLVLEEIYLEKKSKLEDMKITKKYNNEKKRLYEENILENIKLDNELLNVSKKQLAKLENGIEHLKLEAQREIITNTLNKWKQNTIKDLETKNTSKALYNSFFDRVKVFLTTQGKNKL